MNKNSVQGCHYGMRVVEVTNQSDWYEESTAQGRVEFLQSWEFGEFLRSIGRTVCRLQVRGSRFHQMQCVIQSTRFGLRYAYAPRVCVEPTAWQFFLDYFRERGMVFVRVEPINDWEGFSNPYRIVPNRQARDRWILDVTKTELELLGGMHAKTRYNIHLAQRRGVEIKEDDDVNLFWNLNKETTRRNKYTANPKSYYEAILGTAMTYQTTAYYQNTPVASAILLHYKDTLVYLFGASSNRYRHVMAPTFLQWYNIKKAKQLGCHYYDFLGCAPPPTDSTKKVAEFHRYRWDASHQFSQVTRFKAGFGGQVRSFSEARDIIIDKNKYLIYRLLCRLGAC